MIGVHIVDPREEELPNVGLIRAVDAESGQSRWIDSSLSSVREQYSDWFKGNLEYFKTTFLKSGADTISIRTNEPYINALLNFFKSRNK